VLTPERCADALTRIDSAIDALERLMLSDGWDALPEHRQASLAQAVENMRLDAERLEPIAHAWISEGLAAF
jgi:hypothetical protein